MPKSGAKRRDRSAKRDVVSAPREQQYREINMRSIFILRNAEGRNLFLLVLPSAPLFRVPCSFKFFNFINSSKKGTPVFLQLKPLTGIKIRRKDNNFR